MRTILYTIWLLIPATFFLLALWAKLEEISNANRKQNPNDFMRQGWFVLLCVIVAIIIERYMLEGIVTTLVPDWFPLSFYQVVLLPIILTAGAAIAGPTKEIRISRAPRPSDRRKRK